MSNAKLLVPAGVLTHDSCGETFSPTQFGLFGAFALLLAAFTGSIPPSLNVVEEISNTPCADAAHQDATTIPLASRSLPITRFMSFLRSAPCRGRECSGRKREIKAPSCRSAAAGRPVGLEHFGLEHRPDLAMQLVERGLKPHIGDVARPRQRHRPVAHDVGRWPRRHDDHAV